MTRYIIRRLLQGIPLLFIISLVLFFMMMNMGDPVATMGGRRVTRSSDYQRLKRQLGLDKPIYAQYFYWLVGNDWSRIDMDGDGIAETAGLRRGVLRGDFGTSLVNRGTPVLQVIGERLPNTLILMGAAEIVIILGALLVGVYSALRQYSVVDNLMTTLSFIGYSMPIFFIALILMSIFAVLFKRWNLPYLPTVGMFDPQVGKTVGQVILHMILPVVSMSIISLASYSRYIRSTMLEVLGQDYIRTARSKGLPRRTVVYVHALEKCLPANRHSGRSGSAAFTGWCRCHRTHFRLAWDGTFVPRSCGPGRYTGGDGYPDADRSGSGGFSDHHRYCLRMAGSAYSI